MEVKKKVFQKKSDAKAMMLAHTLQDMSKAAIPTDVQGSYTGTPRDGGQPEQDADDL